MRYRLKIYPYLYALIMVMVSGCAHVELTSVVRVNKGEVQLRECKLTVWTVIIAMGYRLDNCQEHFIQFGKTERASGVEG